MPQFSHSAAGQRSWRQKAPAAPVGGGSTKTLRRILYSLLGLGLTGLLIWLIWWWFFLPVTYFACLPIVDYDVLAVPPIPFSQEDTAAFAEIGPPERTVVLGDLQTSEGIATLSNRLQGLTLRPKDVLILSIDAQGVSDDGVAYLLASDYLRNAASPDAGRYKLRNLLDQIRQCPAGVKLLLLDANHLASDPRLGMMANEFPRLLEEEVKNLDDPALWVISAAGPMQISQNSATAKRSIFSRTLTDALRGAADANRNGTVELDELFRYLRREVPKLAAQITPELQSPCLLHGGTGPTEPPEKIALAPISPLSTSRRSVQEEGPGVKAETAKDKATTASADKPPATANSQLKGLLEQAWTLRDKLQDRSQNDGWSPIDYAPHLWREFNELLLGYERRYRSGAAFDVNDLAANLRENILAGVGIAQNADIPSSSSKASVVDRLASARRDFLQNPAKKRLDQKDSQTTALKNSLQLKNDLAFWTPDYVHWHSAAARLSDRQLPLYQPLNRLMEKLPAFCDILEASQTTNPANGSAVDEQELRSASEELVQLRDTLENRTLHIEAQNLLDAAKKTPRPISIGANIEELLTTPLLPVSLRKELLAVCEKFEPVAAKDSEEANAADEKTAAKNPAWLWQRLAEQAVLERQLVLLADPSQNSKISLPEEILHVDGPEAENRAWIAYRRFGKQLGEFYAGLPQRINKGSGANVSDQSAVRSVERCLRIVDARDAKRIDARALTCTLPLLPEIEQPKIQLTLAGEKSLQLPREGWLPFEITLTSSAATPASADVNLQFDGSLMEITNLENKQPISPGKKFAVALDKASAKPLKLQARTKRRSEFETKLDIEATLGDQNARTSMNFRLAPLDVIDLTPFEFGRPVEQTSPAADRLRLRPFPNRSTEYRFALVNRSGRARKVQVEFFTLPPPAPDQREIAEYSPLNVLGNTKPGVKRLAGPVEIALPADDSPTPITFPEPKPVDDKKEDKSKETEKPKAENPTADKPGGPKPEEKTKPAVPLTNGMACVIRDAETNQPRWIKRIVFSPRPPRDYLQPDVSYDAAHGRISIRVMADESQNPPELSPESPINIVWSNVGELPPDVTVKDRAVITAPGQTAALFADVESSADKKFWVRLTADGYPRAFVYLVRLDRDREHIPRERSLEEIRIASPAQGQAFRVPLEKPIPFEMQVDAPEDSFRNDADMVQVRIVAEENERELCPEEHRWFFSDRQTEILLADLAPSGQWKIEAKVGDFNLPLGAGGLKNTKARIMGEISLSNPNSPEDIVSRKAFAPILLQGSPPVLGEIIAPVLPIPQGKPVEAYVTVEKELSGIKEMQIGIDRDNSGGLEDAEKPEKLHQPAAEGKWRVSLPTEDLKPGRYVLIAKATDAVGFTAKATKTITIAQPPTVAEKKAATTSTIAGRVTDQDGQPIRKIRVSIKGTNFSAESGDDGEFTIKDVPHGKYQLDVRGVAKNREVSTSQEIILPAAVGPVRIEVRMNL